MKSDLTDISETRKNLRVEIPSDIVDAEIDRVARDYSRKARIPGFRPGKVPPKVIKHRFRDQILNDVEGDELPAWFFQTEFLGGVDGYPPATDAFLVSTSAAVRSVRRM